MAEKKIEPKQILEREYIVPMRKGWLKVPEYKRANKAMKTLKEFIAQHMKLYDRDIRNVKVDNFVNNEIRFKGMKKPPARLRVRATKFDNGIVRVSLVVLPKHLQFEQARIEKKKKSEEKKKKDVPEDKKTDEKKAEEQKPEESTETKAKEMASRDEGIQQAKEQARKIKHTTKEKQVTVHRKALSR